MAAAQNHHMLEDDPNVGIPAEPTDHQQTAFYRIIMSFHDFIMFLQDLYVPADVILTPPQGGWPQITKETWSSFGKSDEVIDVLRHLTYIDYYKNSETYEFLPCSGLCDFRSRSNVKDASSGKGREIAFLTEDPEAPAPAHVVGLINGGRNCRIILLDCRNGLVYGQGTVAGGWCEGEKIPVERYFSILKDRYRQMQLLPMSEYQVVERGVDPDTVVDALVEIFTKHGWPHEYQRDACIAEISKFEAF